MVADEMARAAAKVPLGCLKLLHRLGRSLRVAGRFVSEGRARRSRSRAPLLSRADLDLLQWLSRTYVRPHLRLLALAVLCAGLSSAATATLAWLAEPVLDEVIHGQEEAFLYLVPLAILTIATVNGLALYGQAVLMQRAGLGVMVNLRSDIAGHFIHADLSYLNRVNPGDLIARCVHDAEHVQNSLSGTLFGLVRDALTFLCLVAVMLFQDWRLALVSFIALPPIFLGVGAISSRARALATGELGAVSNLVTRLSEVFEASRLIKLYGTEERESRNVRAAAEEAAALGLRMARNRALSSPINEILGGLAIALTIVYGSWSITRGELSDGSLASFLAALALSYRPLKRMSGTTAMLQEGIAAGHRVRESLRLSPKVVDRPGAVAVPAAARDLRFEKVCFSYDGTRRALDSITLEIGAGRKVALVGPSGAGKSTLIALIPRLYDLTDGAISIGGRDIRDYTLASLRAAVAVVTQETTILDGTIRANIAYARPDASEAAIAAAARVAGADEFIAALPQGYDTLVGPRGVRLSGGQRQRIAIARALLKSAPILLLDEPSSSLDQRSERSMKCALDVLMQGRTTLIAAHRVSLVMDADHIFVLDKGRIVEQGCHAELMGRRGLYAQLFADQSMPENPAAAASNGEPLQPGKPASAHLPQGHELRQGLESLRSVQVPHTASGA